MPRLARCAWLVALVAAGACAPGPALAPDGLEAEARAFMAAYADDLRAGDAEAVAARYSRRGAYRLGNGQKAFSPYDSLRASYAERWRPPSSFEWRDLSVEVLGPDAVAVLGRFRWGAGERGVLDYSYTGVLVREDGELRIRVEDESADLRSLD